MLDWTSRRLMHEEREIVFSNREVLLALRDHKTYKIERFDGEQPPGPVADAVGTH